MTAAVPSARHPKPPLPASARIPRATYRVQLHAGFRFDDATALVPYLAALGISHLYISPPLRSRPGSRHGYDAVDHGELNPELGTREDFDRMVESLRAHGMGLLVDMVPNHMGVHGSDNAWWADVLENGAASAYADYFDIDWTSSDPTLAGKVLLPLLGEQYGTVLERGDLKLSFDAEHGTFALHYFEHCMPIDPASYGHLLRRAMRRIPDRGADRSAIPPLAAGFDRLPPHDTPHPDSRRQRRAEQAALKSRLSSMASASPGLRAAIDAEVIEINGRAGQRASFDALHALLDAQPYRLAHWRVAADEINYRRFFDINDLAALRMERAEVFEATHRLVLTLAAAGAIDGLRIDHPDGLADPAGYFRRLQERYAELAGLAPLAAPRAGMPSEMALYVVVEKIVAPHEQVPREWSVHGTTGYRFANVINGLLIDGAARARLDRTWRVFVGGEAQEFHELAWSGRHAVMDGPLAGELTVLAQALLRLAREDRRTRDFTLLSLRRALTELLASFPVYRTYVIDEPSVQDRRFIEWAVGRARRRSMFADASVFDFLRRVLLGRPLPGAAADRPERMRAFTRRLQQYMAPVAAKGIEDTALYRHHRLISVNDVGGDPDMFGMSVAAFHAATRDRAQHWPHTMLATSTHDAKRSEDVRCRLDVISEMPAAWRLAVRRWSRLNRRHKRTVDGASAPSRNDEYFLYQTLAGSLPIDTLDDDALAAYARRIEQTLLKSCREAKTITSWMNPHAAYEASLSAFVQGVLQRREANLFLDDLRANVRILDWYGALNGLTLALLKALSPGVPDYYQGHEAIELTLVDPDNRQAVDFGRRIQLLEESKALLSLSDREGRLRELLDHLHDGRAKFWVTWRALQLRRDAAELLNDAAYVPLEATGQHAEHVVAFARGRGAHWIVAVAPRLYAGLGRPVGDAPLGDAWGDTAIVWPDNLPAPTVSGWLENRIDGRRHAPRDGKLRLAELLREFPVAALFGAAAGHDDDRERADRGAA